MATSSSYNFATDRDTLIKDAMLYIGAIGEGETPSSAAITEASRMLNMLIKSWAGDGMPLWAIKRGYILPFTEASSISTSSHVVTSFGQTAIGADEASSQTALTVDSTTGMEESDQIGIEMDDGTMHWTTISSVDDATTVTVATAIDDDAADGNRVYFYTATADRIQRPLRVFDMQVENISGDTINPINQVGRQEYFDLGDRDVSEGVVNQVYYDPELGNGTFYVFPRFQDGDTVVHFSFHRPFQDFDAATDEPDCPQEFYLALTVGLAALLGPKYGVDSTTRKTLIAEAEMYRQKALETVYPEGSLYFQPHLEMGD